MSSRSRSQNVILKRGKNVKKRRQGGSGLTIDTDQSSDGLNKVGFSRPRRSTFISSHLLPFLVKIRLEMHIERRRSRQSYSLSRDSTMKLPNADAAVVAQEKIRDYLLNAADPG